jgi:Tol biopolymer transport system component
LQDIFLHDRLAGSTIRVSISSLGVEANGGCFRPAISDDGRYVAFDTEATSLYGGDFNGVTDVYVYDTLTAHTTIGSISSFGLLGDKACFSGALSGDGRYLAFLSSAQPVRPEYSDSPAERDDPTLVACKRGARQARARPSRR